MVHKNYFDPHPPPGGCSFCISYPTVKTKKVSFNAKLICRGLGPQFAALTDWEFCSPTVKKMIYLIASGSRKEVVRKALAHLSDYFHYYYFAVQQNNLNNWTACRQAFMSSKDVAVCFLLSKII